MNCPGCDIPLQPLLADSHAVVRCPQCQGLWLDSASDSKEVQPRFAGLADTGDDRPPEQLADLLIRLLDRNAEFQSILDHVPAEIVLKDTEGRYVLVNRRFEQLNGLTNQQVRGKLPQDLFPRASGERLHESAMSALASGQSETTELDDAEGRTFLGTLFPVRDWHGKTTGLGAIGIDITERRRAELALQALNDELEARIEERTRELRLIQDELLQKERLATLGQITGMVSHELRNPLSVVRTTLYVIERHVEDSDPRLRDAVERVKRNLLRCDRLIDELLDYARTGNTGLDADTAAARGGQSDLPDLGPRHPAGPGRRACGARRDPSPAARNGAGPRRTGPPAGGRHARRSHPLHGPLDEPTAVAAHEARHGRRHRRPRDDGAALGRAEREARRAEDAARARRRHGAGEREGPDRARARAPAVPRPPAGEAARRSGPAARRPREAAVRAASAAPGEVLLRALRRRRFRCAR